VFILKYRFASAEDFYIFSAGNACNERVMGNRVRPHFIFETTLILMKLGIGYAHQIQGKLNVGSFLSNVTPTSYEAQIKHTEARF
jgi:hypothetical protein